MENVRRHINVDLVTSPLKVKALVQKPTNQRSKTFIEDGDGCLIAVNRQRAKVVLKKPVFIGFTVLGLFKVLMYEFHYQQILVKYGADNTHLLFTDTDTLMYDVTTSDVNADMLTDLDKYDTSDYPPEHPLHSNANKKVIGKFKDETEGNPIREFVGLRAKMYSYVVEKGRKERKKAKGVKKSVLKRKFENQDFKDCLFNSPSAALYDGFSK